MTFTKNIFPADFEQAILIGRVHIPNQGTVLCWVTPQGVFDLSPLAPTCADLLALEEPAAQISAKKAQFKRLGDATDFIAVPAHSTRLNHQNGIENQAQNAQKSHFLAPCDLQAIKAAGVTFVSSMLERVIEEQARGDASKAVKVREKVAAILGDNLRSLVPGSDKAAQVKAVLIEQGLWSQYLEVGIGPDAEVFTKAQPMSAVGVGAEIGIHPKSEWNNPEPEMVLVCSSSGKIVGATLGNDVNLRDFEGRSALLLSKAKDNNASCAMGPFIRLFDSNFTLEDVRQAQIDVEVKGTDGYLLQGKSYMSQISRDPLDLVAQTCNENHQYPDGFVLFCGTMFAPTQDRFAPGAGFTHAVGDIVNIHSPKLGTLSNIINTSDKIAPWSYGVRALMRDLSRRGLLQTKEIGQNNPSASFSEWSTEADAIYDKLG